MDTSPTFSGQYVHRLIRERACIFIDFENIFYAQRTLGWRISYQKLLHYFRVMYGDAAQCFVYSGCDERNLAQLRFLSLLASDGYIVRSKNIKKIKSAHGGYQWKNSLDMTLAFDMVDMKDLYDTAVLLSGDSDFDVPLDRIRALGKRVVVMSTKGHVARELLVRARFVDLDDLRSLIAQ